MLRTTAPENAENQNPVHGNLTLVTEASPRSANFRVAAPSPLNVSGACHPGLSDPGALKAVHVHPKRSPRKAKASLPGPASELANKANAFAQRGPDVMMKNCQTMGALGQTTRPKKAVNCQGFLAQFLILRLARPGLKP